MSSTSYKLANKTKSKSKLHHHAKQTNDHINKIHPNTKNASTSLRRPLTPSVDYLRYPEPETILKQIEKNVNVLKEIYEASVSQRNAFKNSEQTNMSHSQKVNSKKNSRSFYNSFGNKDITFQAQINGKKSVPEIHLPISESADKKKKKAHEEKQQQRTKKSGNNQETKRSLKKSKSHSEQNLIKIFERRRKSIANIQKQVETIKNTQSKPSAQQKEDGSCNHLLQIFKFYKRSIDSSMSKYSHPLNVHSNDAKSSLFSDHNNYHSIQNKSHSKQTPHNSSTKIVTNHKGSSIDPSFQASIEGQIWKQDDDLICRKPNGINTRNNDRKIQLFKKKTRKDSAKSSRVSSQQQKKQSLKGKTKKNQSQKTYNQDLLTKISKDKTGPKGNRTKAPIQRSAQNSSDLTSKPKKLTKKKPQLVEFEQITFEKPVSQLISKKNTLEIQKFDFPEIQSSAFNRDMPILEEDSRQQLSSSMMIVPGNSINFSKSPKKNRESPYKIQDERESESEEQYFLQNKNSMFNQQDMINEEIIQKVQKAKSEFILYSSKNKKVSPEQNTRFPTPSFVTSQSSNQMLQMELNEKQNLYLNFDDSDGSLAGCEIPKDRNDSFAVQQLETSSFDL